MNFDDVELGSCFEVTNGIIDRVEEICAPGVFHDDENDIEIYDGHDKWEPLTGFTGQYSYNGAVMHSSETLSGRLANEILSNDGIYALVIVEVCPTYDDPFPEPAGWAVFRLVK